jgi:DNA-binding PadR family transcriptional regulator
MSSDELTLFSYEILGLVGRGGVSAHDMLKLARRGRILDWAGESQYYVEPKRLARIGYLDARKEPGKTRERTVYTLTPKAHEALAAYARTPVRFQPVKSEMLLRLLLADLVGEAPSRESVSALRAELDELYEALADAEQSAERLPHRAKYLHLVNGFLRRLLDLHGEFIETVERELKSGEQPPTTSHAG